MSSKTVESLLSIYEGNNFIAAPFPPCEVERLKDLYELNILHTGTEERFDRYTRLCAEIFDVPICLITLMADDYQWFKSCYGITLNKAPRNLSFCSFTLLEDNLLIVNNTLEDERFKNSPYVLGDTHVRFYAGCVLRGPHGFPIGTLCLYDTKPKKFSKKQQQLLSNITRLVENEILNASLINQALNGLGKATFYNPITDLPNMRLFRERCVGLTSKDPNHTNHSTIIALMIKNFNYLKNSYGQTIWYKTLKEFTKHLLSVSPDNSLISHNEENTFLLMLNGPHGVSDNPHSVEMLIKQITKICHNGFYLNEPINSSENPLIIFDCAIGLSHYPTDSSDITNVIENAVIAMHVNANVAENVTVFNKKMTQKIAYSLNMETRLRQAVNAQKLYIVYQPILSIKDGSIYAVEALCRWKDDEFGDVSPMEFIPIAERTGLITQIGDFVLERACSDLQAWQALNLPDIKVSVNITKDQLFSPGFSQKVKSIITRTNLSPSKLALEITESGFIGDIDEAVKYMKELTDIGVSFSIDDFGTGYSSLSYLRDLPISVLKIDKTFIKSMHLSPRDSFLIKSIIAIGKNFNLKVIAEGVEDLSDFKVLSAEDCDYVQGYLFSAPLSEPVLQYFLKCQDSIKRLVESFHEVAKSQS